MDRAALHRTQATQAVGAGAAEQAHDDGFDLVVAVVSGGDAGQLGMRIEQGAEETVSQVTAGLFQALAARAGDRPRILRVQMQRDRARGAEFGAEAGVGVGVVGAQAVVQVGRRQRPAAAEAPVVDREQERHRVGSAGHRDEDSAARGVGEPVRRRPEHPIQDASDFVAEGGSGHGGSGEDRLGLVPRRIARPIRRWAKKTGSGSGTRTPDTRIMIPML